MIDSFYVKNFRLFKELKIKNIGRVNLISGKNNSGKTALLEAFFTYLTQSTQEHLFDLLIKRQEDWSLENDELVAADVLRHLFLDHHLPFVGEEGITLGQLTVKGNLSKKNRIEINTFLEIREQDEDDKISVSYTDTEGSVGEEAALVLLSLMGDGKILQKIQLQKEFRRTQRMSFHRVFGRNTLKDNKKFQFVTTEFADNYKISTLWDAINLTDLESEVISGLKIIEPRVEGVAFVEGESRRSRVPLIKLKGTDERLSLKSLGDGVFRVFYMILSLVNAKGGCLIIDEFENGLHWSVQEKIWKIIFALSIKLDVQVFVTSHSRDCVKSFETIWKDNPKGASFHRLSYEQNMHSVTTYNLETLSDSMEMDVEVR